MRGVPIAKVRNRQDKALNTKHLHSSLLLVPTAAKAPSRSAFKEGTYSAAGVFAGVAGQVQLTGTHRLEVGGLAIAIEFGDHGCWP